MNPKILISIILLLGILFSSSHSQKGIDSLKIELSKTIPDTSKVKIMNDIIQSLIYSDPEAALNYVDSMRIISNEVNNEFGLMESDYNEGVIMRIQGDYDSSVELLSGYLKYARKKQNEAFIAKSLYQLGTVYQFTSEYEKSIELLNEARTYAQNISDKKLEANILNVIGILYKNLSQYQKSLEIQNEAKDIAIALKDSNSLAIIYNGIGVNHTKIGDMDKALQYFKSSLEIAELINNPTIIGFQYRNIGMIYMGRGELIEAENYLTKALQLRETIGSQLPIAGSYTDIGQLYLQMGKLDQAETYLLKGRAILEALNSINSLNYTDALMADLYKQKRDFENYSFYLSNYYSVKDSLDNNDLRARINDIDTKYETAKKESELQQQQFELERKTSQRNLYLTGFGLSILFGGSFIWGLTNRSKKNKLIVLKENELQNQKIRNLEKEKQILSISSLLEGQEKERIRIAKDLHDGLGGLLTSVKAHFSKIQSEIEKVESLNIYNSANEIIDKAHEEVRRISHNLMPSDLRVGGLSLALTQLVHETKYAHEIQTDLEILGLEDIRLDEKTELFTYRIIQELINNVIKHANAEKLFLQIAKYENELHIVVEDDGKGFDLEDTIIREGLGIRSIFSRVEQLGGTVDFDTKIGEGTSVSINLPIIS